MFSCNITELEKLRRYEYFCKALYMNDQLQFVNVYKKAYLRVQTSTLIILSMVYAFPCVFFVLACPHVHMFAPACILVCRPASRVRFCPYVCVCMCVYVFQESQWLDSVSLLIKDTIEGEMLMIDNLSGSVFHHYSSPPVCKDCKGHPQEQIRMAEIEQASLKSVQLSDKSSSPALPDELSLDEHTSYLLLMQEGK
ncbi:hypothetical protein ATANTOWER_016159, partial [Ataeniobius toweri]|nr:hypothetical protein [Ataeniobius toweri]